MWEKFIPEWRIEWVSELAVHSDNPSLRLAYSQVKNDENHWMVHDSILNNPGNIDSSKVIILFKSKVHEHFVFIYSVIISVIITVNGLNPGVSIVCWVWSSG